MINRFKSFLKLMWARSNNHLRGASASTSMVGWTIVEVLCLICYFAIGFFGITIHGSALEVIGRILLGFFVAILAGIVIRGTFWTHPKSLEDERDRNSPPDAWPKPMPRPMPRTDSEK